MYLLFEENKKGGINFLKNEKLLKNIIIFSISLLRMFFIHAEYKCKKFNFFSFCLFSEFQKEKITTVIPKDAPRIDGISCGRNNYCIIKLNEVCVGGVKCMCRPGEGRATAKDSCQPVERIPLAIRVLNKESTTLSYSSDYGSSDSASYVEITHLFTKDIGRTISSTTYGTRYVTTDVNYITHPKTVNRYVYYLIFLISKFANCQCIILFNDDLN